MWVMLGFHERWLSHGHGKKRYILEAEICIVFVWFSEDTPNFVINGRHSVFTYLISYQASLCSVAHHLQIVSTAFHEYYIMTY